KFLVNMLFYFFFQAEDGIRVFHVTGVQTCALPIFAQRQSHLGPRRRSGGTGLAQPLTMSEDLAARAERQFHFLPFRIIADALFRSEERRVGKESRYLGNTHT